MKQIKTWHERCEEHPDHQERIISESMIQARMQEEIDELRQALGTEPVAWQPIESAPKTGRKVILFYKNRLNVGRTVIARWLTDEQATEIDADDVGLEGGWYECIDNWDDFTEVAIHGNEPSHWMPLPAPPIEALRQALETEQKPVAWRSISPDGKLSNKFACKPTEGNWVEPLYTAPPKAAEWVGLHGSEVPELYKYDVMFNEGWWWAEEKLKEKNHD